MTCGQVVDRLDGLAFGALAVSASWRSSRPRHEGFAMSAVSEQALAPDQALTLELAQKLIRLETADPPGNEAPAARLVAGCLDRHGIAADVVELAPNRANLVARLKGSGERPALVFNAHFDTIGVDRTAWTVDPFGAAIQDGRLYGRGATDMKGALAAMTTAAIALKQAAVPLRGDLVLAFTAAENTTCLGAHELVRSGALAGAGALLISEPTSLKVFTAEKGALWLRATAHGEYGHNAFSEDRTGDRGSAILRMSAFLQRVQALRLEAPPHRNLRPPTINVGLISGGLSKPLIAPSCVAEIDVRTVPGLEPQAVVDAFEAIAGPHVTIEFLDFKPPVDTPDDHPFVQTCVGAARDVLGREPEVSGVPYYTDGAILAPALGVPMVILGPGEVGRSGSVDEYVQLDRLHASAEIFLEAARRYLA
jgi:succinyl-diaminopimelate desuccinylase